MRKKILFLTILLILIIGSNSFADWNHEVNPDYLYTEEKIEEDFGSFQNLYDNWIEPRVTELITMNDITDFNYQDYLVVVIMEQEEGQDPWNPSAFVVQIFKKLNIEEPFILEEGNYSSKDLVTNAEKFYSNYIDVFYAEQTTLQNLSISNDSYLIASNEIKDINGIVRIIGNDDWKELSNPVIVSIQNAINDIGDFVALFLNWFTEILALFFIEPVLVMILGLAIISIVIGISLKLMR